MKTEDINKIATHLADMKLLSSRRNSPTEASSATAPTTGCTSIAATSCSSRKIQQRHHSSVGAFYQDEGKGNSPPLGCSLVLPNHDELAIPVIESSDEPTAANNIRPAMQIRKWKLKHRALTSSQQESIKQVHVVPTMRPTNSSSSTPPNKTLISLADFLHFGAPKTPAAQPSAQHCLLHLPPTPLRVRLSNNNNGYTVIPILPKLVFLAPEMKAAGQCDGVGGRPPPRRHKLKFRRSCDTGCPSPLLKRARHRR